MTDNEITLLVKQWQQKLKLQHWEINLEIVDHNALHDSMAQVEVDFTYLNAKLKIARIDPDKPLVHGTMSKTIIHELVHIHLAGMNVITGTPEHMAEEQAAQILSRVIWEGYK